MRPITAIEAEVIETLISDAEIAVKDMTQVLSVDEPAVRGVLAARDWLRGILDTRLLETVRNPATCHWYEEPLDGCPCIGKPLTSTVRAGEIVSPDS